MDKNLFTKIEKNIDCLLSDIDSNVINSIIKTCINHKLNIVKKDQYDNGIRNILNFGFTEIKSSTSAGKEYKNYKCNKWHC